MAEAVKSTVSAAEIARFAALAARWWDPDGPMRPLHRMNAARIGWITAHVERRFGQRPQRLLDIGCGAGLAAEALARHGHQVLGLDAAPELIAAARAHAADKQLPLAYRAGLAEELVEERARFPVISALEVIEHVPDPAAFLRLLAQLLEPGGIIFISTLNRTARAWLTAKLGAEYLLRLLPVGTHEWRRFVPPAELAKLGRAAGLRLGDAEGMQYDPIRGGWRITRDLAVNYIAELGN
jgi:2-polyprenyl-6-hydroxyphenyl methylase / 3-demethylubiquinone-9 3-methyltransferase